MYSTYNYGILDDNEDDDLSPSVSFKYGMMKGDWTYFYYGYSFDKKEAFAYLRYPAMEDSKK